jgi:hypothetical protein
MIELFTKEFRFVIHHSSQQLKLTKKLLETKTSNFKLMKTIPPTDTITMDTTIDSSSSCSDAWQKGAREISCSVQDIPNLPQVAKDLSTKVPATKLAGMAAKVVAPMPAKGGAGIPAKDVAEIPAQKMLLKLQKML